ncbi:MAG: ECF-type sigma factor, partial [Planctomycetota bacterium JB042]
YAELRELAGALMAAEPRAHTLQPTALVHEAWLRLGSATERGAGDSDRAYFLGAAARAMRRILVDHARGKKAAKRGGGRESAPLEAVDLIARTIPVDVLSLNATLERLAETDRQLARIVELRYFAGLTLDETAAALGLTARQVDRAWTLARGWLHRELRRGTGEA